MIERCSKCKRERPTYIADPTCNLFGGYCDWREEQAPGPRCGKQEMVEACPADAAFAAATRRTESLEAAISAFQLVVLTCSGTPLQDARLIAAFHALIAAHDEGLTTPPVEPVLNRTVEENISYVKDGYVRLRGSDGSDKPIHKIDKPMSETDRAAVERCAKICESMVVGGRAWTEEQRIAADALFAAAANIRALGLSTEAK